MEKHYFKSTGISLISGALLIILTMVLHPSGGSIEHIIKISKTITIAHSLAIFSLPILLFGFYGLTLRLMDKWKLSFLGFIIIAFGLIAAMFAALFNGLTLPYFLNRYADRLEQNIETLKPITNFSFAVNVPLDYIFIIACCLSILIYSLIILFEGKMPKWIGYLGIFITLFSIVGGLTDFVFTSLTGFRIFTFSIAAWVLSNGICLIKFGKEK
ncbi:hypothetical protein [Costertonia aggregata]|uniref:DUF4386 domain-containing protein n=1 Tax=Costertonia aggregata TaxID=343403 RepID=A0A7H9AML1_9FLAO|nr:hypothetical protein [Costertonia aggregata]QLG44696.1 hypothetical protein HYG79_04825 [Costertonia aggregata]